MTDYETHVVGGTTFRWPTLPSETDIGPVRWGRLRSERDAVLAAAARKPTKRTCSANVMLGQAHTCTDPAGCSVAHLRTPRYRATGAFQPGERVVWNDCGVERTGEVWAAARGNTRWVVPEDGDYSAPYGLPCVPMQNLRSAP